MNRWKIQQCVGFVRGRPIPGGLNFEFTGERGFYGGFETPVNIPFSFTGETGERGFFLVILSK